MPSKPVKPAPRKAPAKKAAAKKVLVSQRTITKVKSDEKFDMPLEVKNWIERAHSIMNHQRGEIERLKEENKSLKAYKRFAETRILRSEYE